MFLKNISIQNFKAIENMTITFQSGINLLIGDNGVGKSSVLNAVVVALGGYFSGVTDVKAVGIQQDDVRMVTRRITNVSDGIQYMTPVMIHAVFHADGMDLICERSRKDQTGESQTKTHARELSTYANRITNDMYSILPIFSYQSVLRGTQFKRSDFGSKSKNKLNDRRCGYIGCLDERLDINEVKQWCLKMEMEAFKREHKIPEYEAFKKLISTFMQKMSNLAEPPSIEYSRRFDELAYYENGTTLPISCLSAGYQALLFMIMDIAYRLAVLNPAHTDLGKATGIILIDEIDMHLHPKWQWNVLTALESTLPNVQFIIATHSPIVISSCKHEKLILIDAHQEVSYLENAYGYSIQDVVEFRQGSSSIPKELRELRDLFERYFNEEDYIHAKEVLKEMIQKFGEENSEVVHAKWQLEMEI